MAEPRPRRPRLLRGRGLRLRLTLWYGLIVAAVLTVALGIAYARVKADLYRDVDSFLAERNAEVAGHVPAISSPANLPDLVLEHYSAVPHSIRTHVMLARTATGRLLPSEDESYVEPLTRSAVASGRYRRPATAFVKGVGDVRVLSRPLTWHGQVIGRIASARALGSGADVLSSVRRLFIAIAALALVLASAGGFLLLTAGLRPLRRMRRVAAEIADTDLEQRVGGIGREDEIGEFARTFDDMLERIEGAFRGQRDFLRYVSHELRTPLGVIQGHLDRLAEVALPPAERERVAALLQGELARMQRLVDDLLQLARAENPAFLRRERVDAVRLVWESFQRARGLGERDWRFEGVPDCELEVDPQRVQEVLLNLAENAVRHTGAADRISFAGVRRDGELALTVTDAGAGFPEDDLQRVFEPFYRASEEPADARDDGTDGGGTGLGLSIVRAIVSAHGGTVRARNVAGGGAAVEFTLPLAG